jgi:hypothetical protein
VYWKGRTLEQCAAVQHDRALGLLLLHALESLVGARDDLPPNAFIDRSGEQRRAIHNPCWTHWTMVSTDGLIVATLRRGTLSINALARTADVRRKMIEGYDVVSLTKFAA